ncbi:MAG: LptF/LptG family permease [Brevinema sp.]
MIVESIKKLLYTWFYTALDRYFYSQLLINYIIGVSFFSSIIMINELYYIIRYYFEQNVPLFHVLSMMGALMPFLVSFSVPFGVLPAYLLLMGQLSQDSEIVAMRACGISQFRIMLPGIIFGIAIMIFAFNFKNYIETASNTYYLQLKSKVLSQKPVVQLLDNVFLNIGSVQLSFERVSQVEGSEDILHNVYAVDVANRQTIRAEEGRIYVSPDNPEHYIMKFLRGDINQLSYKTNINILTNTDNGEIIQSNQVVSEEFYLSSFGAMTLHNYVWLPGDGYYKGPDTYTFSELKEQIDLKPDNINTRESYRTISSNKNILDRLLKEVQFIPGLLYHRAEDSTDLQAISNFMQSNIPLLQEKVNNSSAQLSQIRSSLPNYDIMKLYDKLALPAIALVFAILSLPLGMFSARSGRGEGLSISLVIVLVFYGFKSAIENTITQNKLPPEFVWLPTICFGLVAIILYIKKLNE